MSYRKGKNISGIVKNVLLIEKNILEQMRLISEKFK